MKKLTKAILPLCLVLVLVLSLNLTAFADDPPPNIVNVSFTTGQNSNTMGNVVENIPQQGLDWINTWLCNPKDDSGLPITGGAVPGGPVLHLTATEEVRHADGPYILSGGGPYTWEWGFPVIGEDECQNAYAEFGDVFDFTPGFEAVRDANTIFPSTGGTQYLTLEIIPREGMMRLDIPGTTQVGGLGNIATVTNVEVISDYDPAEGIEWNFDDYNFWIGIENPITDKTYEFRITIEIGAVYGGDPSVEMVYMPFIQVKNVVGTYVSGIEVGSSISKTSHCGRGSWLWEATEDYVWNWTIDEVKDANLNGYSYTLCTAKSVNTEMHFHLSNQTLHLYDGNVVPDGSQWINGNLFTFTHPGTPSWAEITSWSYVNDVKASGRGTISGSFTMEIHRIPCPGEGGQCFEFGPIEGTISVAFNATSFAVPHPFEEGEPSRYNFEGNFQITGGTGFYEGIGGSGTIGGTFHNYDWSGSGSELEKWFDFVIIGKAMFRGR